MKSPGQTVVEAEGARNTWARRMALREGGSLGEPYMTVDPSPREIWRLAVRIAMSFFCHEWDASKDVNI